MQGWVDHFSREPWGFPALDMRHGMLCSIVSAFGGANIEPQRFMLGKMPSPEEEDVLEQLKRLIPPAPAPDPAAAEGPPPSTG